MDAVWLISMQRRWKSGALKKECKKWFSLLLKAVEIRKGVESILSIFLEPGKAVIAVFYPYIQSEVCLPTPFVIWFSFRKPIWICILLSLQLESVAQ